MKGVIFTILQDMIESQMGIAMWDDIVCSSDLKSEGIYTSAESYDDEEVFTIVAKVVEKTGIGAPQLLEQFGQYLFPRLHSMLPKEMFVSDTFFNFLCSIDSVIHVEVKKLDESAELPEISVGEADPHNQNDKTIVLHYRSSKKLCHLAIGLLKGAAVAFSENVEISMPKCMHEGHDHCELILVRQ